jgi:hypothetical protein
MAIDGTPVDVVFFNIPVARPDSAVPFIFPTTVAPCVPVTSPVRDPEKLVAVVAVAAFPVVDWLSVGKSEAIAMLGTPVEVVFFSMPVLRLESCVPLILTTVAATLPVPLAVTSPVKAVIPELPLGVAHVPSPRQNVVPDAEVPEFRFVTGKLPVTWLARFMLATPKTPLVD